MSRAFSLNCKIVHVAAAATAATTDVTTSGVDMGQDGGYEGVCFISTYGTAAAGNLPHGEQSTDNSSFADLLGTEVNVGASDEKVYLDILHPQEQYVRAVFKRGTSSTLGDVYAILYGPRKVPVDNTTAGTIHGELHVAPAEGTI